MIASDTIRTIKNIHFTAKLPLAIFRYSGSAEFKLKSRISDLSIYYFYTNLGNKRCVEYIKYD